MTRRRKVHVLRRAASFSLALIDVEVSRWRKRYYRKFLGIKSRILLSLPLRDNKGSLKYQLRAVDHFFNRLPLLFLHHRVLVLLSSFTGL